MTPYERQVLADIHAWRNPPVTWMVTASEQLRAGWSNVADVVHRIPGVDWTMENVVAGLLDLVNEITQDSVWADAVLKDFNGRGHDILNLADIRRLDLEHIDETMMGLDKKYVGLATAEGAATGLAGAAGIVPDVIALVSINLRAAGEMATYCGFDMRDPEERMKALFILDEVAKPGNSKKNVTLAPAMRTASKLARVQGTQLLEQIGVSNAIEGLLRRLGVSLTEKKLAQMVPVTGAFVGGGLNYMYTSSVCQTAYNLYRERFLIMKYGEEVLRP